MKISKEKLKEILNTFWEACESLSGDLYVNYEIIGDTKIIISSINGFKKEVNIKC